MSDLLLNRRFAVAFAFQCHPEMTQEMFEKLIQDCSRTMLITTLQHNDRSEKSLRSAVGQVSDIRCCGDHADANVTVFPAYRHLEVPLANSEVSITPVCYGVVDGSTIQSATITGFTLGKAL